MIDLGNIRIVGHESDLCIKDFKLKAKFGEHAHCYVKVECMDDLRMNADFDRDITIYENENKIVLFRGKISRYNSFQSIIEIDANSDDIDLDMMKKKRIFQNVSKYFSDVIEETIEEDSEQVLCGKDLQVATDQVIYQYEETNWEFCKRMASLCGTYAFPIYRELGQTVLVGTINGGGLDEESISLISQTQNGLKTGIKIAMDTPLILGSTVSFKNVEYVVMEENVTSNYAQLQFDYSLTNSFMCFPQVIPSATLGGLVLKGKVDDVATNSINVTFNVDSKSKADFSYPWKPITSNLLYCMPEKGTTVLVQLHDEQGIGATAFASLRDTRMVSVAPSTKLFTVPSGKKITFTEDSLLFSDPTVLDVDNILSLEAMVLSIKTPQKLESVSGNGCTIMDADEIDMDAPKEISIHSDGGGDLVIYVTVDINGDEQITYGLERIEYTPFDDAPKEIKKSIGKLLLKILAAVLVVAVAVFVATVALPALLAAAGVAFTATTASAVIATCVAGGFAFAAVGVGMQVYKDKMNGIDRPLGDYIYMWVDQFCTGAILTAPFAMFPGLKDPTFLQKLSIFGLKGLGVAVSSSIYQGTDRLLDYLFGGDFYDVDANFLTTLLCDVLCGMFCELAGNLLGKLLRKIPGYQKLVDKLARKANAKWNPLDGAVDKWSRPTRTALRALYEDPAFWTNMEKMSWEAFKKTYGEAYWKAILEQAGYNKAVIDGMVDTIMQNYSLMSKDAFINWIFTFIDKSDDGYEEIVPFYYDFDSEGNLVCY